MPVDGSPVVLGNAEDNWVEARLVKLPVYEDMTTHEYSSIYSTYWVRDDKRQAENAVVDVNVGDLPIVPFNKQYLLSATKGEIEYYKSDAEACDTFADVDHDNAEGWRAAADRSRNRVARLKDVLADIQASDDSRESLFECYSAMCRAVNLL